MSKFTDMADTSHRLSLTAMEEASRYGQRTADIDHLLLALTVNEQVGGQVLRSLGVTLVDARDAVEAQHSAQMASLGLAANAPAPGPIAFHETGGYEWSERALTVIRQSGERGKRGDAAAVLRELVTEPSGLTEALLHRLDTTPDAVLTALDEAERTPAHSPSGSSATALSATTEVFAPAPVNDVWNLLADPARMPEWDQVLGSVDTSELGTELRPGDHWQGRTRTERPDGKEIRVKPEALRQRIELRTLDPEFAIAWRITYPDAPQSNARLIGIRLAPAAGGTQLDITFGWERNAERRPFPLLRFIMRPIARFAVWMQLTQLGTAISRVFR